MNLLGRRSLSSVLGTLVTILFSVAWAVGGLLVVLLAIMLIAGTGNFTLGMPVAFNINPSAYQLSVPGNPNVTAEMEGGIRGSVRVAGIRKSMAVLAVVVMLTLVAVAGIVLFRLRRIFWRLRQGKPFLAENATDLRFIGWTVVAGAFVVAILEHLGMRFTAAELSSQQLTFLSPFLLDIRMVLSGLVLVIVAEVFREGSRMRSDLDNARDIQFSLVAAKTFRDGPVSVESRMVPARDVGGDYYDIIDLGDGRIALVMADVAGKGLPAALLMTLLRGSVRSLMSAGLRGTAFIEALNRHLIANTPANRMVTGFFGEIDPVAGRLRYVNAGHNPPFLIAGGTTRTLEPTGIVLGMIDGMPFEAADVDVSSGARLLVYTDGISEATSAAGDEFRHGTTRRGRRRRRGSVSGGSRGHDPRSGEDVRRLGAATRRHDAHAGGHRPCVRLVRFVHITHVTKRPSDPFDDPHLFERLPMRTCSFGPVTCDRSPCSPPSGRTRLAAR